MDNKYIAANEVEELRKAAIDLIRQLSDDQCRELLEEIKSWQASSA